MWCVVCQVLDQQEVEDDELEAEEDQEAGEDDVEAFIEGDEEDEEEEEEEVGTLGQGGCRQGGNNSSSSRGYVCMGFTGDVIWVVKSSNPLQRWWMSGRNVSCHLIQHAPQYQLWCVVGCVVQQEDWLLVIQMTWCCSAELATAHGHPTDTGTATE